MQDIVASASSEFRGAYEWWQSFGPVDLVGAFLAFVIIAPVVLWFTFQNCSPVFWRRTDYAYFILAILGGIGGAADLAFSSWTKQAEQIQMNMLTNGMLLRGDVFSALSICEQHKARAKEQAQFGPGVINPNKDQNDTYKLVGPQGFSLPTLSVRDCPRVDRIWSDIQNGTLQDPAKYGIETVKLSSPNFEQKSSHFFYPDFDYVDLMTKISLGVVQIVDAQAQERAINEKLSALSYLSIVKSLSPILLGFGIGIRLARTHYDVKTEKRKARKNVGAVA